MKNIGFLFLAVLFFGAAFYVYWLVTDGAVPTSGLPGSTIRSLSPQAITPPSDLMQFLQQWQPVLSLLSSIGGAISFFIQVRIWLKGRNTA